MSIDNSQISLLALCRIDGLSQHLIAREAQRPDGLERLLAGQTTEQSSEAKRNVERIRAALPRLDELKDIAREAVEQAGSVDAVLHTVLDESYPTNLRLIFNLPPFLFVRGQLEADDLRSVAVVGTRKATDVGLRRSASMARLLVGHGVTVVSGMARGIDTAAHQAALAEDGRTIAVIGTGIMQCYPAENRGLCDEIADKGAVVSQFWPDSPPAKHTFPRRNITMSGISQGTVVIEASSTSGAKMQARFALEHGKKLFLLRSLVDSHEWAAEYADRPGVRTVDNVEDVVTSLVPPEQIRAADERRAQLSFQFG
ncbi:DNA-processing protein DprA [Frankia sp. AgKG'84/4]|uniref:DNA-processing protein DprA n=1 Tax=Frankia sp. AgKG'84/4 TaxID=573490 RepID=UPI00200F4B45|nr:DNA-processing protein DprA [Frankia sp. AgKG'84/4]MCL9796049.1 DNA-protecting protein DprA [Frankia sp. AgKG'84/4]